MAEDVNVKVGASADVSAGLNTVVSQLKSAVDSMMSKLASLSSASGATSAKIKEHNTATGLSFQALQTKVEGVHSGLLAGFSKLNAGVAAFLAVLAGGAVFEKWIADANEFTQSVTKLGKMFGINSDEATTFAVALHSVGLTNEAAEGAFRKFEIQVKRNSAGLKALGVDTEGMRNGTKTAMEGFLEAIQVVGQYKEGQDQLQVAMQILGTRGMADIQKFLRLTKERMQEAEAEQRRLGLTVTEESLAMSRAYTENMAGVHTVFEAIGKVIAESVMPRLTAMAQWFRGEGPAAVSIMRGVMDTFSTATGAIGEVLGLLWSIVKEVFGAIAEAARVIFGTGGEAPTAMEFFRNVLALVQIAIIAFKTGFLSMLTSVKDGIEIAQVWFQRFAESAERALNFDVSGAIATWDRYGAEIERLAIKHQENLARINAEGAAAMSAAALAATTGAEGTKGTIRQPKGGLTAPDFGKKKGHESDDRMAEWREELQKKIEAEVGYFNDSKALEIKFWEDKLAIAKAALAKDTDTKSEAYKRDQKVVRELEKMLFSEHKSAANKQLTEDLKVMEDELAAAKNNIDEQIRIAKQMFDIKSIYYSQDVAKIADANKKIVELEQKKADMIVKLDEKRRAVILELSLLEVQSARETLAFDVEMGRISNEQRYAQEVDLANRVYALNVESIRQLWAERMAKFAVGSAEYLTAEMDMNKAILDETKKTEAEIVKIKQAAIKEAAQYELSAVKATQDATATLLDGLISRTKTLKQAALDWANTLSASLNKLVAQNLMEKIMGPGTQGQDFLSKMFGGLFGTKGGGGSAGAVAADAALTGTAAAANALTAALTTAATTIGAGGVAKAVGGGGGGEIGGFSVGGLFDKLFSPSAKKVDTSLGDLAAATDKTTSSDVTLAPATTVVSDVFDTLSTTVNKGVSSLGTFFTSLLSGGADKAAPALAAVAPAAEKAAEKISDTAAADAALAALTAATTAQTTATTAQAASAAAEDAAATALTAATTAQTTTTTLAESVLSLFNTAVTAATTALDNMAASAALKTGTGALGGGGGGGGLLGSLASLFKPDAGAGWISGFDLAGAAAGTNYVPNDMILKVHKGEAIVPAAYNKPERTGGVTQHNTFVIQGNVDTRTQDQIAARMSIAVQRAASKNL